MDDRRTAVTTRAWEKLGILVAPDPSVPWMQSHAQLPVVVPSGDDGADRFDVFFASRDANGRSHIGRAVLDLGAAPRVVSIDREPVLSPGPIGTFDADGVYPASFVVSGGERRLYYVGWLRGVPPPLFFAAIGLATARQGAHAFARHSFAPIVDRGPFDPCLVTSPTVFNDGTAWRMVYVSGLGWDERDGQLHSRYHLKTATSQDGIGWSRHGRVAVDFKDAGETNLGRGCVVRTRSGWQLWFCAASRTSKYRLAYAESADGITWQRCDERAGLTVSSEAGAFDSEMVAYPFVVRHGATEFLFYNGNNFGRDGFAVARRAAVDD
jgi:hypothetical protein